MDNLENINAEEGLTHCQCGCKYWENDRCIDCGTLVEIVKIRYAAFAARYLNKVWLNSKAASMTYYDLGWTDYTPAVGDLNDINALAREKGWIL